MKLNISHDNYLKNGIYSIHNVKSNKYYIGKTWDGFYKRYLRHKNALENNKHFNSYLQHSFNKHGTDCFEFDIVEVCDDKTMIGDLERYYIKQYRDNFECYNILAGGEFMSGDNHPFAGKHHTPESKQKLSLSHIGKCAGERNFFYGKDHSGEKNGFYGHKHTEESRRKMSETKSKMYVGERNPFYGKKHKPDAIEKIKQKNIAATHREVICLETGIKYRSIAEAERQTGASAKQISAVCAGHGITAGKLHWKYANQNDRVNHDRIDF